MFKHPPDPIVNIYPLAGLLSLSGSLYNRISALTDRIQNLPQAAFALRLSVSEVRLALTSVSGLIDSFMDVPYRRRAMVQLDHLIICLTQLVLVFDELDRFVGSWPEDIQHSLWRRWRFSSQDEKMIHLNSRIQQHKTSICLLLNVLQCESDIEARRSGDSLHQTMLRALEENEELRNRLGWLETGIPSTAQSINTVVPFTSSNPDMVSGIFMVEEAEDQSGIINDTTESQTIVSTNSNATIRSSTLLRRPRNSQGLRPSARVSWSQGSIYMRPFENILARSPVYTRVRGDECDISFNTHQPRSGLWSLSSNLSLSQISSISVIALPLSRQDIHNNWWYEANGQLAPGHEPRVQEGRVQFEASSTISPNLRGDRKRVMPGVYGVPSLYKARRSKFAEQPITTTSMSAATSTSTSISTSTTTAMYTIAILGETCVGKSALARRFCYNRFETQYPTILDSLHKDVKIDGVVCQIYISDVSGNDEYDILVRESINEADAFIVAYSVVDWSSFLRAQALYHRVTRSENMLEPSSKPVSIVGTKSDKEAHETMLENSGRSFASNNGCEYFNCSAKTGENVDVLFTTLVKELRTRASKGKGKE